MGRREQTAGGELAARGWQRWWSWWADRRRGGPGPRTARRIAAALLITAGGVLAVIPTRATAGSPVAVALADLPTGEVITAAMVHDHPAGTPPDGAMTAQEAVGRTLAGPVRRGELLTDARLVAVDGPDPGPDRVAVPVRLDDPGVVALLRPGLHVAVLAVHADDPGAPPEDGRDQSDALVTTLAGDAVVLSVPTTAGASPLRTGTGAGTVLIAVPDHVADVVAAHAALGAVTIRFT